MVRRLSRLVGPRAVAVAVGVLLGAGATTFGTAKGWSYLGDDPASCANCHVMQDVYDAWRHGSHAQVATCNDCHVPHGPVSKWIGKAVSGAQHSYAFTLDDFDEPIRIHPPGRATVEANCRHCHAGIGHDLDGDPSRGNEPLQCTHCHRQSGHEALR